MYVEFIYDFFTPKKRKKKKEKRNFPEKQKKPKKFSVEISTKKHFNIFSNYFANFLFFYIFGKCIFFTALG